jgi:hypothetical protein
MLPGYQQDFIPAICYLDTTRILACYLDTSRILAGYQYHDATWAAEYQTDN